MKPRMNCLRICNLIAFMKIFFIFIFLISFIQLFAQDDNINSSFVRISGFVKNEKKKPVEAANIVIEGTIDGATTDETGYFEFETSKIGKHNLIITALNYSEKIFTINIEKDKELNLNIIISKQETETDEIVITASSFTSGQNSQVTLTPLEIARIPGADADLYRAITTFPGTNQVDEGSRIAVRGGDPDEVLTILDQASLYNPFIFDDSYNMSSFSTVNPWGLKGINFSSGGFSAKYGNALSAVLDLKSYTMPQTTGMFFILGLANAGLSGVYLSKDGKFGATFNAQTFFLKPYLAVNGTDAEYSPLPSTKGIGGTLSYKLSKTNYVKFYADYNDDKLGIKSFSPTYEGFYKTESNTLFSNLSFILTPTSVSMLNMSLSFSSHFRKFNYGIINNSSNNIYSKFRVDYSQPVTNTFNINTGAEYEYSGYKTEGQLPFYFYNIRMNAPFFDINQNKNTGRFGAYVESLIKLKSNLHLIAGLRSDYHTFSKNICFDPRLSVVYKFSEYSYLKGATGIYHQFASLQNYLSTGNDRLKPEEAIHYILGYEYNKDGDLIVRIESYYKDYKKLLLPGTPSYSNSLDGTGTAKGIDVFVKVRFRPKFNGWISYSYTDSKRKQFNSQMLTSANYDITHTLNFVGSYNISDYFTIGASYKITTGKPFTPVVGSTLDTVQNVFIPLYALYNSERFPAYNRMDLNAQYVFPLFGKFAVAFFALNNVLNQKNIYEYTYNYDYSKRIEIASNNKRSVYFGIGMQL